MTEIQQFVQILVDNGFTPYKYDRQVETFLRREFKVTDHPELIQDIISMYGYGSQYPVGAGVITDWLGETNQFIAEYSADRGLFQWVLVGHSDSQLYSDMVYDTYQIDGSGESRIENALQFLLRLGIGSPATAE